MSTNIYLYITRQNVSHDMSRDPQVVVTSHFWPTMSQLTILKGVTIHGDLSTFHLVQTTLAVNNRLPNRTFSLSDKASRL